MDDATLIRALPWVAALAALAMLFASLRAGRRKLLVDNLPVSKTTGVFIGVVELTGSAESDAPVESRFSDTPCVYYRYKVLERYSRETTENYTDNDGTRRTRSRTESGWSVIEQGGTTDAPFQLKDERGSVRILPKGATVEPREIFRQTVTRSEPLYGRCGVPDVEGSEGVRQFVEEAVLLHAPIFVVGHARQRADVVAAEIAAHDAAPMFLISTKPKKGVSRGLRLRFWGFGVLGIALALSLIAWRENLLHPHLYSRHAFTQASTFYLAAWLAGWVWMAFNGLVDLRQRVEQGWANIDVELKRRAELLPNIIKVVSALRDHERTVQGELAVLRTQVAATAPGRPGPDPAAAAGPVRAIAEAYPELKSNALFATLQKQLVDTEDRIALARGYFNEIAAFYNTRIQSFPDGFVAALGGMRKRALMQADGFEHALVQPKPGTLAGPCAKCGADVRSMRGLRFCAFCGGKDLDIDAAQPHCRGCGAHMHALAKAEGILAGSIHFCCHCGTKLAAPA